MNNFKQHFGIPESEPVDFLNIPLDGDLEVFIDPFAIANNQNDNVFGRVFKQLSDFLQKLNRNYITQDDRVGGLHFLDNLHEPNEYHLGYSSTNKGFAIADTRADVIYSALRNNRFSRSGTVSITNEAHNVLLLVNGIGQDIMSDTIANVCRNIFAKFTEKQCQKHGIPLSVFNKTYFNPISGLWEAENFSLPSYLGKPIILIPNMMASAPRQYSYHYNYFVCSNLIAKDILNGKFSNIDTAKFVRTSTEGRKNTDNKLIYATFHKPKADLVDFVLKYPNSLNLFLEHAKHHYPPFNYGSQK